MWEFICQQTIYRQTYMTASRPTDKMALQLSLTDMMLQKGLDTVIRLKIFEAVK